MGELQSSRVARAVASKRQLEEVMTDFWLNHFNVFAQRVRRSRITSPSTSASHPPASRSASSATCSRASRKVRRCSSISTTRAAWRTASRPRSRRSSAARARSPADGPAPDRPAPDGQQRDRSGMRQRLNQLRNGGLNENYGRELLELHTLGVDGGYTQQDVIDVARALTGWTIRPAGSRRRIHLPSRDARRRRKDRARTQAQGRSRNRRRRRSARHRGPPSVDREIHRTQACAALRIRQSAAGADRPRGGGVHAHGRRHSRSGPHRSSRRTSSIRRKHIAQGEVAVRGRGERDARNRMRSPTRRRAPRRRSPISASRSTDIRRRTDILKPGGVDEHRRDSQSHQFRDGSRRKPNSRRASIARFPVVDSLRSASREKQVDAVVSALLGGSASPETRAVLMSGENPLLANAQRTPDAMTAQPDPAEPMDHADARARANPFGRPNAAVRSSTGIAQVVGLALGSPEFQRR